MDLFHLAYPVIGKEKLKTLIVHLSTPQSKAKKEAIAEAENALTQINEIVVPFYLPLLHDITNSNNEEVTTSGETSVLVEKTRGKLRHEWTQAVHKAVSTWQLKKAVPRLVSKIVQRFTFQWGLLPGVFEKFSVNCLFNSDLYYVNHYRNFIFGYNEDNTVG